MSVELGASARAMPSPGVHLSLPWIEEMEAIETGVQGMGTEGNLKTGATGVPQEGVKPGIQFQVKFQVDD